MNNKDDEALSTVLQRIEREKALIKGANDMRAQSNDNVKARLDNTIRDARKNLAYFEEKLRELQMRKMGTGIENMNIAGSSGQGSSRNSDPRSPNTSAPPMPPPKDSRGRYMATGSDSGNYGSQDYSQIGGHGDMMPPRHPYAPPGPNVGMPKSRPNFTKLDLIKYDTPYLGPRIQLMLSQLEFKLGVEKQYYKGIEKMLQLYHNEGDRKSKADAAGKKMESSQKIQILKQSLKRYEDLHINMDSTSDAADDDSINIPNMRKPLTGSLYIRVMAVQDVDHATTGRFTRGPDTFVTIKVEDNVVAKTKTTKSDKWSDEHHNVEVDKANELEITVYDKTNDHPLPIGLLWIRLSDIVEEMRRKRIEAEINSSGWVSADRMGSGSAPSQFNMNPQQQQFAGPPPSPGMAGAPLQPAPAAPATSQPVDAWFALEPTGQIHLSLGFTKHAKDRRPLDLGLNRKGAIRQRKEEVHEMYGHKFITQQFYNIMRCALCGEFLKYSAGMQCEDCKYTCHTKCYTSVVTKCISKSNAESDPDEEKINHRIPHRFEKFNNLSANWCCHCGYILPFGKRNCRKCSECSLTAHAACVHLVPDFCGMNMATANLMINALRQQKAGGQRVGTSSSMSTRTLRQSTGKPAPQQPASDSRSSFTMASEAERPPRTHSYGPSSEATEAAKAMYNQGPTSPQQQKRPSAPDRNASHSAAAAAAAMAGQRPSAQPGPYQRSPTDYVPPGRNSGGYPNPADSQAIDNFGQSGQQSSYNPQDYAAVSGYPVQAAPQPQMIPPQQPPKQTYAQQPQQTESIPSQIVVSSRRQPPPSVTPSDSSAGRRIGLDHFNFLAVLGKGNFGKVMLAETKASKKLYAIKVLKKEFIIENDEVESTRSEKRVFLIANKERHPFLLNLHACFQTETRVYFVMEYISGGDLMLHIQRGQFTPKRAQFYAAEVCLALKYFHENGVIYRDLKLDNILLTMEGHIKIGDYGLCKEDMYYGSTTSTFCGTPEFMAPEILLDKKYGRAVDWWAFGVLIYQMLLQQSPFRGEDEDEIYDAILADEPLYPIHMPRDSVSILQKLLTREPELRLGSGPRDASEIMDQPFFKTINWDDIYNKRIEPPYKPQISSATDTSNFDSEFTNVTPVLTPVQSVLTQAMQEEFRGFSYSADFS